MGTIAKQIAEQLHVELITFEPAHDGELCAFIDFMIKIEPDKFIGITLYNGSNNHRNSEIYNAAIKDFEVKYGRHFEVCYDSATDTIINLEVLDVIADILRGDLKAKRLEMDKQALVERGLTLYEAETFMELLDKITPTQEDIDAFYKEMDEGIPFEGGMGFTEALTAIKEG